MLRKQEILPLWRALPTKATEQPEQYGAVKEKAE